MQKGLLPPPGAFPEVRLRVKVRPFHLRSRFDVKDLGNKDVRSINGVPCCVGKAFLFVLGGVFVTTMAMENSVDCFTRF